MKKYVRIIGPVILTTLIFSVFNLATRYFNTSKWKVFTSNQGRFKIEFPKKPNEMVKTVLSDYGELSTHIIIYDASNTNDDNLSYSVSYVDYPDSVIYSKDTAWCFRYYNKLNDRGINTLHGKLDHVASDSIGEYPGQEIKISFKDGQALYRERDFLVKNRLYSIGVITSSKNDFNKGIDHFFDTFKLL